MIKVAIIDDHAVVRVGFKYIVSLRLDMEFVGEHPCGVGALDFVQRTDPDVLFLDIRMPDRDGLDVLKEIRAARPWQKVVMLTTSNADNDVYTALNLGAKGYLLKDRDSGDIAKAAERVAGGGKFVPEAVMELYRNRKMMPDLTQREADVLNLVEKGKSNDEIAADLSISPNSVKQYLRGLFTKLDVTDRVSAVREAAKRGFLR